MKRNMNTKGAVPIAFVVVTVVIAVGLVGLGIWFQLENNQQKETLANIEQQLADLNTTTSTTTAKEAIDSDVTLHEEETIVSNTNSAATNTNSNTNQLSNTAPDVNSAASVTSCSEQDGVQKCYLEIDGTIVIEEYELSITAKDVTPDTGSATLTVNYSGADTYDGRRWDPGATGYVPNPRIYSETNNGLLRKAKTVYRTHYFCSGERDVALHKNGYEIIDLSGGYSNYVCRSREQEQCVKDGSFDKYYDEQCDFGNVVFYENKPQCSSTFGIQVVGVTEDGVTFDVFPKESSAVCSESGALEV